MRSRAPSFDAKTAAVLVLALMAGTGSTFAQSITVRGSVRDDTGGLLPGVVVQLRASEAKAPVETITDSTGHYSVSAREPGRYQVRLSLVNFSHLTRSLTLAAGESRVVDAILPLAFTAEVAVTGVRTFRDLADVVNSDETLIGLADAASEGAITANQLENRPLLPQAAVHLRGLGIDARFPNLSS